MVQYCATMDRVELHFKDFQCVRHDLVSTEPNCLLLFIAQQNYSTVYALALLDSFVLQLWQPYNTHLNFSQLSAITKEL